eukprot:TRINITY_DN2889_c0_g1_i1.p1 TRINITY_DN2889_c0_g1~~TRINITY_DN2889_c0_g1_i1.p1  ORF type:complete len:380 (+),score=75.82 TRINITY_DN2889_c0_g1_i1:155-1141(+)
MPVKFKSGVSYGHGLTKVCQWEYDIHGNLFVDTPGLSDIQLRQKAATEISTALNKGGSFKVFFVMTLEAGRVRPDDKTTMSLVHQAAPMIGSKYSIVINKVSEGIQAKLTLGSQGRTVLEKCLLQGLPPTSSIAYFPNISALEDATNADYKLPWNVLSFFSYAPMVYIPVNLVHPIQIDHYDTVFFSLFNQLQELQKENTALQAALEVRRYRIIPQIQMVCHIHALTFTMLRAWICNMCKSQGTTRFRYRCNACDFDLCYKCSGQKNYPSIVCPCLHDLVQTTTSQLACTYPEYKRGCICDVCGGRTEGPVRHCQLCHFDVCKEHSCQ